MGGDDEGNHAFIVVGLLVSWILMGLSYAVLLFSRYLVYKQSKAIAPVPLPPSSTVATSSPHTTEETPFVDELRPGPSPTLSLAV
ncbi:hypothetical protein H310_03918 [Aphanomyces invadans]|uniref:Uncharacterized protein n=1 Tax=Aphanomyces invadans TaxID=157072 RepID=A0A024UGK9_9STRA|nr:hypothetical protein H310_03918 [Aphanomyces invadans]ETW04778.1 hypothetical protein H310_03918 [Aphanomyces invadans]|eukprot:XP_008866216.1 hypothetical protein H310_03918 [Aphanomyces invadans]